MVIAGLSKDWLPGECTLEVASHGLLSTGPTGLCRGGGTSHCPHSAGLVPGAAHQRAPPGNRELKWTPRCVHRKGHRVRSGPECRRCSPGGAAGGATLPSISRVFSPSPCPSGAQTRAAALLPRVPQKLRASDWGAISEGSAPLWRSCWWFGGALSAGPGPVGGLDQTLLWRPEGAPWRSEWMSEAEDWLGRDACRPGGGAR